MEKKKHFGMDLKDIDLLKELGIRAMPRGAEYALLEFERMKSSLQAIEKRADLLQTLELDDKTRAGLAGGEGDGDPAFFRDLVDPDSIE